MITFPSIDSKTELIFNQFFGIGDILFIEPIMRRFFQEGYKINLPILKIYLPIQHYFPYINFIEQENYKINYEEQRMIRKGNYIILPMRWSREYFKSPLCDTMRNKYRMVDLELNEWRKLTWLRHRYKEENLKKLLNIKEGEQYNLINKNYYPLQTKQKDISVKNEFRNIEMGFIDGYTLLDWAGVIENAENIYTMNTSLLFLCETLELKTKEIHLYSRHLDGHDFKNTEYLRSKNYIKHNI